MSFPANPAPDAALVCVHGIHHALTGRVLQTTNNLQREEAGEAVGVQLFWIHFTAEWEKLHGEMYGVLVGCAEMDPSAFPSIIILSLSHAFDNSIRQPSTCKVAGLI